MSTQTTPAPRTHAIRMWLSEREEHALQTDPRLDGLHGRERTAAIAARLERLPDHRDLLEPARALLRRFEQDGEGVKHQASSAGYGRGQRSGRRSGDWDGKTFQVRSRPHQVMVSAATAEAIREEAEVLGLPVAVLARCLVLGRDVIDVQHDRSAAWHREWLGGLVSRLEREDGR